MNTPLINITPIQIDLNSAIKRQKVRGKRVIALYENITSHKLESFSLPSFLSNNTIQKKRKFLFSVQLEIFRNRCAKHHYTNLPLVLHHYSKYLIFFWGAEDINWFSFFCSSNYDWISFARVLFAYTSWLANETQPFIVNLEKLPWIDLKGYTHWLLVWYGLFWFRWPWNFFKGKSFSDLQTKSAWAEKLCRKAKQLFPRYFLWREEEGWIIR